MDLATLRRGLRFRPRGCLGRNAGIGGSALELVRGLLHVLQRARGAQARDLQMLAQLARRLGHFLDQRRRIIAQRETDPAQAPDQHRQH